MSTMAILRAFAPGAHVAGELDEPTLRRCCAGDRDAFRSFVLAHQRVVFAYLGRMLGPGAPVEDVAQHAFLRAFRAIRGFDPQGPARLSTWMLAIARHAALDHLRKRRPDRPVESLDHLPDPSSPERDASLREVGRELERAASRLPDDQREVFVLFELHGLPLEEIAAVVSAPVPTVKTRLFRAREKLRAALAHLREEETP